MRTFSFLLKNDNRIDVEASSALAGFNKLNAIPYVRQQGLIHDTIEMNTQTHEQARGKTAQYLQYNKDGFADIHVWEFLAIQ